MKTHHEATQDIDSFVRYLRYAAIRGVIVLLGGGKKRKKEEVDEEDAEAEEEEDGGDDEEPTITYPDGRTVTMTAFAAFVDSCVAGNINRCCPFIVDIVFPDQTNDRVHVITVERQPHNVDIFQEYQRTTVIADDEYDEMVEMTDL